MGKKLSELVEATAFVDTDIFHLRTTGAIDKKITGENFKSVLFENLFHVQDEKTSGVEGGTFTSGAWRTRDLNTVKTNEISGASLASNQITLPIGTYEIEWFAPAYRVNIHKARLYNITDAAVLISGQNAFTSSGIDGGTSLAIGKGQFTLTTTKVLELQHKCQTTKTVNGLGTGSGYSTTELYTIVLIRKISN